MFAVTLVATLLIAGGPYAGTAYACSCAGTSSVGEEFRASDAVFSGEMIRGGLEDPSPNDGAMYGGVAFRVDESWKGVSGESAVVYGQDAVYYGKLEEGKMYMASSCAFPFEKGEGYLVYANRYEDGFRVEPCSGTELLADAGEDLAALGPPAEQLTGTGGPPLPRVGAFLLATGVVLILVARILLARARA